MVHLFTVGGVLALLSLISLLLTGLPLFQFLTFLFGACVVALYWFLRRSLPAIRGNLTIEGLREAVEVYRDERGIPHVYARNQHDLYLAQGYVTAQDRIWQMEISRRAASGRLAEILGPRYLERDRHLRTVGLRRAAEASLAAYSPECQEHLEAYAAGVNAFLNHGKLPPEFSLLRRKPEPWSLMDTLAVFKLLSYELSNNWADQLFQAQLAQAVGAREVGSLYGTGLDSATLDALEDALHVALPGLEDLFQLASTSLGTLSGSNAWVIAADRTRSGQPMLGSDLHAAPRVPTAWFQAHLIGPDRLDVTGVSFPGVPGILFGQTRDFAWSLSSLGAQTQDLVLERANPVQPDQFAFQGGWEPAEHITEQISVQGQPEPVPHEVLITRHGPILVRNEATAIALRSTVLEASAEIEQILQMNRARSLEEFRQAAKRFTAPAQAILFAGRDGSIARLVVGAVPIRRGSDGQMPCIGWTGQNEWEGFIPTAELPEVVNPPEGFLVAANQDLTPPAYPYQLCSPWMPPYRAQRLTDRIRSATAWSRERGEEVLTDTVNPQSSQLLQLLLAQLHDGLRLGPQPKSLGELEKRALLLVTGWDGDEQSDSPAALLWQQWYLFLLEGIMRPQMGLELFDQFLATKSALPVIDRLLTEVAGGKENAWLGLKGEQGLPRLALRSFRRAVALLAAKHGSQPDRWRWGKEHRIWFRHPLSQRFRLLAPFLDLGPYPVGGSDMTLFHNSHSLLEPFGVNFVASYRRVVDLGLPEDAVDISAPGSSGHPLSPFFSDQLQEWLKGGYAPLHMRHSEIRTFPCLVLSPAEGTSR